MARTRNDTLYNNARGKLLDVGIKLIRLNSYAGIGISDILREANIPKGSFYHYFSSKEDFGVEVLAQYNEQLLEAAQLTLNNSDVAAKERLKFFFWAAYDEFEALEFSQGCLMCNLSTELADVEYSFQQVLEKNWCSLSSLISNCIAGMDKSEIGLDHLTNTEAADWLLNSWSGALTRMKAVRNGSPLQLFLKTTFQESI